MKKQRQQLPLAVSVVTSAAFLTATVGCGQVRALDTDAGVGEPDTYAVGGTVSGLLPDTAVNLRLEAGGESEGLKISGNGPFAFARTFEDGTSYRVTVEEQPTDRGCIVDGAEGAIAGADVTSIVITCQTPGLVSLELSAPVALSPVFSPDITSYAATTSVLVQTVTLTPTATVSDAAIAVNGAAVTSGTASRPIALALGETTVEVKVTVADVERIYTVAIDRGGEVISQLAYVKASNTDAGDRFGVSIAASGDTIAVSATEEDSAATSVDGNQADNSAENSGAVYVFRRSGSTWVQEAYLKASNADPEDAFGFSIALSGDTLVVGAYLEDSAATGVDGNQADDSAENSGAVYVFGRAGSTWAQEAYLKASNTNARDGFGWSVALDGDTLAVSAQGEASAASGIDGDQTDNSSDRSGAVYIFRRSGDTWSQEAYVKASNTDAFDSFGNSVALAGDTLAVGAVLEDSAATGVGGNQADNTAGGAGAVYVFERSGSAWVQTAYLKASNTDPNDTFGFHVAISKDTIAVGARGEASAATGIGGNQADNTTRNAGAVYVFRRAGSTWAQEAYVKASNTEPSDRFGNRVALDGDILAVGAPTEASAATGVGGDQADNNAPASGAVYVFRRSGSSWTQEAYVKASNTEANDVFGPGMALVNGTLAIGAVNEDSAAAGVGGDQSGNAAQDSGAVYLFH